MKGTQGTRLPKSVLPYLFAYDIGCDKRRGRVLRVLKRWRVDGQYSVHETLLRPAQVRDLSVELMDLVEREEDKLLVCRLDRRGSALEMAAKGVLLLRYPDGEKVRVGLGSLAQIVVIGEVALTSDLLRACNEAGVGLVLLPARGHGESAIVLPGPKGRIQRRMALSGIQQQPQTRLTVARELVVEKIAVQGHWLGAHGLTVDVERFQISASKSESLAALMGAEGAAAARYFKAWGDLWETQWGFQGRNRRPPLDPVNSMLSLGYTLAGPYVGRMATRFGLDVAFGFLHESDSSRAALMLDLLEPVRPWVDQRVWTLAADGLMLPEHFHNEKGLGCRLTKEGRGIFFGAWFFGEELWFRKPARRAIAIVLNGIRKLSAS